MNIGQEVVLFIAGVVAGFASGFYLSPSDDWRPPPPGGGTLAFRLYGYSISRDLFSALCWALSRENTAVAVFGNNRGIHSLSLDLDYRCADVAWEKVGCAASLVVH